MRDKILVVDDEKDIVSMLRDYFEINGYDVMTALSGVEAIKKAEKEPDLILLDINMPDIDGMEVCARIRDFVSCPILFLTARKYSLQGTTQGRYLTGGVPPVRFSM